MCGRVSARLSDLQGSSGLVMGWNPRSGSWAALTEPALHHPERQTVDWQLGVDGGSGAVHGLCSPPPPIAVFQRAFAGLNA